MLALGVWFGIRWWTSDPWGDFEEVASTFPVPAGFEQVDSVRTGDRPAVCDVKPCVRAGLIVTYVQSGDSSRMCQAIEGALEAWEQQGFDLTVRRVVPNDDVLCMFQGEIDGDFIRVFGLASARDDEPGFELVIGG